MGFGLSREQAECSGMGLEGLPGGAACESPRAAPSSSLSPLRAQGALHLGGLQQGLALLQLKPLELERGCCCGDARGILWGHPC